MFITNGHGFWKAPIIPGRLARLLGYIRFATADVASASSATMRNIRGCIAAPRAVDFRRRRWHETLTRS